MSYRESGYGCVGLSRTHSITVDIKKEEGGVGMAVKIISEKKNSLRRGEHNTYSRMLLMKKN